MADLDFDTEIGREDTVLAEMLRDQLAILNQVTPEDVLAMVGSELVIVLIAWTSYPGVSALESAEPRLRELVAAHLGRQVTDCALGASEDRCRALISFGLEDATAARREYTDSLRGWAQQTRRGARRNRLEACERRLEARRMRVESRRRRLTTGSSTDSE